MGLSEKELSVSYSQGMLEGVLKNAPAPVSAALEDLVSGVAYYKQKYDDMKQDFDNLQSNYNNLTALSAGYLQLMQQQKDQIDQLLIEQQRPYHQQE
jgi:hypothetical protein